MLPRNLDFRGIEKLALHVPGWGGVGDSCRHCWKCGSDSHFSFDCSRRPKSAGLGAAVDNNNCSNEFYLCKNCDKTGENKELLRCADVKPGGTVAKRAKPKTGIIIRKSVRQSKHYRLDMILPNQEKEIVKIEKAYKTHLRDCTLFIGGTGLEI